MSKVITVVVCCANTLEKRQQVPGNLKSTMLQNVGFTCVQTRSL